MEYGRAVLLVRQSWLGTYMICPERARAYAVGEYEDPPSDAAAIGTALHAAVEYGIEELMSGHRASLDALQHSLVASWDDLVTNGDRGQQIVWVKRSAQAAEAFGLDMIGRFARTVYPHLAPIGTEVPFGPVTIAANERMELRVQGTIDYLDQRLGLVDWKSAGQEYQPWEKQRWSIQPTVYLAAQRADPALRALELPETFTYIVFPEQVRRKRDGTPGDPVQVVPIQRDPSWDRWLFLQCKSLLALAEGVGWGGPWPLVDSHALCSQKWCPKWSTCKGSVISEGWAEKAQPVHLDR